MPQVARLAYPDTGKARSVDFDPAGSDADFLVEFGPDADPGLKDFLEMKEALKCVLGREVDLVKREAIEKSRNYTVDWARPWRQIATPLPRQPFTVTR